MSSRPFIFLLICLLASTFAFGGFAEEPAPGPMPLSEAERLEARRQATAGELETLQAEITLSDQRREALAGEVARLEKDRETINRQLIDASAKSRTMERSILRAENRLVELRGQEEDVRISLNGKRALLAEVLGALQRMGRKPPPALLVTPEDALSSVRSAILLGSVVPEVRSETDILLTELRELVRITNDINANRDRLTADLGRLAEEEARLNLLLEEKRRLSSETRTRIAEESARAAELAGQATSLNSLIGDLEREIGAVRDAAEAARRADEERKRQEQERIAEARERDPDARFDDTDRIAPAIGFSSATGLLPVPVAGVKLASFGDDDGSGEPTKGQYYATRSGARVISPSDGWVLYAGPFRSYGQLLIMNAGEGYHVVLAGLSRIDVEPGQFVLTGEPIGSMGDKRVASAGPVDVSSTRPILYVEFRRDGISVDPAPWWSDDKGESVSNGS